MGTSGTVSITRTRQYPLPFLSYVVSSYLGRNESIRRNKTICGFANPRKFKVTGVTSNLFTVHGLICRRGGMSVRRFGRTLT